MNCKFLHRYLPAFNFCNSKRGCFHLHIMNRLHAIHFITDCTSLGISTATTSEDFGTVRLIKGGNLHRNFLNDKSTKFAPEMGWSFNLLANHISYIMVLFTFRHQCALPKSHIAVYLYTVLEEEKKGTQSHFCPNSWPMCHSWNLKLFFFHCLHLLSLQ